MITRKSRVITIDHEFLNTSWTFCPISRHIRRFRGLGTAKGFYRVLLCLKRTSPNTWLFFCTMWRPSYPAYPPDLLLRMRLSHLISILTRSDSESEALRHPNPNTTLYKREVLSLRSRTRLQTCLEALPMTSASVSRALYAPPCRFAAASYLSSQTIWASSIGTRKSDSNAGFPSQRNRSLTFPHP